MSNHNVVHFFKSEVVKIKDSDFVVRNIDMEKNEITFSPLIPHKPLKDKLAGLKTKGGLGI